MKPIGRILTNRPAESGLPLAMLCFALIVLVSCAGEAPEIRQVFWQLNVSQDPSTDVRQEILSVFVNVTDADGVEDVDMLYIIQDNNELLWELDSDGWQHFERGEESWIGSNGILMAAGTGFPRGLYRLIVIDRSGERSREELFINSDVVDMERVGFPSSSYQDGTIIVDGDFSEVTLWFYDNDDNLVKIFTTNEGAIPIASALNNREQQTAVLYYVNSLSDLGGYGLTFGPVYVK